MPIRVRRLGPGDQKVAQALFALMTAVFEEERTALTDAYVAGLLARADFWVLAAIGDAGQLLGGLTAHTLPMTRAQESELFIYDLAVRADQQRQGVGRALVDTLRKLGLAAGIASSFVPADDDDTHALAFYAALGGEPVKATLFSFEG